MKLPNANSSVDNPEAERAATKAEGPGMGITGTFSLTHNLVCINKNILVSQTHILPSISKPNPI